MPNITDNIAIINERHQKMNNKTIDLTENNLQALHNFDTSSIGTINLDIPEQNSIYLAFKRIFDIAASLVLLVLLSPLFLVLMTVVFLDDPGNPFYTHKRLGKYGKYIKIYKFRTMVKNSDEIFKNFTPEQKAEFEIKFKLDNDPRIMKTGNFLRRTALDEIPQLLNILKGELSFIGPRPIVEAEIYKYGSNVVKFLSVTPGLTGYWQAHRTSATTYKERVDMDMHYIDNMGVLEDIKIVFKTIDTLINGSGAV